MGKYKSKKKDKSYNRKEAPATLDKSEVMSELWKLSTQCKGLGELFGMCGGEFYA